MTNNFGGNPLKSLPMKLSFGTNNTPATSPIKTSNINVITTSRRPSSVAANAPDPGLLTPDIFGRPMEPVPAPLVYINGGLGVGKEAVAESLALLLGQDKSLLVDVRVIGRDDVEDAQNTYNKTWDRDLTLCLMTPEKPGYFDYYAEEEVPLAAAEEAEQTDDDEREGRRRLWASSWSHSFAIPGSTNTIDSNDPSTSPKPASTKPSPTPLPPCSETKLARLLSSAGNSTRIAIIAFCAFDTPMGHTAIATFVTAASLADRMFVPVALTCEPAQQLRRAQSLQRRCSFKNNNKGRPNILMSMSTSGLTSASAASTSTSTPACTSPLGSSGASIGGGAGGGGRPSSNSFSFGARESQSGSGSDGLKQRRPAPRLRHLPLACCPITTTASGPDSGGQTTGSNTGYKLTLDISRSSAFETALQIMELVKRLVAERDVEEQRERERMVDGQGGQIRVFDGSCHEGEDGDDGGDDGRVRERDHGGDGDGDGDGDGEGASDSGDGSDSESDGDADPDPDVYADNFSTMTTPVEGPGHEWKV